MHRQIDPKGEMIKSIDGRDVSNPKAAARLDKCFLTHTKAIEQFAFVGNSFRNLKDMV